jgi:hypothetical protein
VFLKKIKKIVIVNAVIILSITLSAFKAALLLKNQMPK